MFYTASYLTRSRYGFFHLRYPLPCSFHPNGQRDYIRLSLGTRDPRQATDLTAMLRYAGSILIERLSKAPMRYIDKKTFIRQYFERLLEDRKQSMQEAGPLPKKQIQALEEHVTFWEGLAGDGHEGNWTPDESAMKSAFKQGGFDLPQNTDQRQQLVKDWNQGNLWAAQEVLAFSMNLSSFQSAPLSKPSSQAQDVTPSPKDRPLGEVMDEFIKEKTPSWAKATQLSYSRYRTFLLDKVGRDFQVGKCDVHVARKVKDALVDTELTNKTKNQYIAFFKAFFKWATNHGYTDRVLFDGLNFKLEKGRATKQDYSLSQLQLIRQHLIDNRTSIEDSRYWCTMLGMYTGARLNELTQLRTQDVFEEDGIWVIQITDEGEGLELKNSSSKRLVPVHPELETLGFLDFVKASPSSGFNPLFPAQKARARKGADMSRWFNEKLLVAVGIKSPQLDFHSFRRSMNSRLLKAGVPAGIIQSICGHKREGMTEVYNPSGYPPKMKLDALTKLKIGADQL